VLLFGVLGEFVLADWVSTYRSLFFHPLL